MNEDIAQALVNWEDHPEVDNFELIDEEITDKDRWYTHYQAIYLDKRTDEYWSIYYARGSTEYQDNPEEVEFFQVWPHEVKKVVYTTVKPV